MGGFQFQPRKKLGKTLSQKKKPGMVHMLVIPAIWEVAIGENSRPKSA